VVFSHGPKKAMVRNDNSISVDFREDTILQLVSAIFRQFHIRFGLFDIQDKHNIFSTIMYVYRCLDEQVEDIFSSEVIARC
jgi:hypothetical protein